jgi:hypothetical protein
MKKYLMTGIAALALGAGFTSCSHDIEPMTQEEINQIEAQKIVQTYEQAFVKTFGQPAANQNWGFGAANLRTRDANTEVLKDLKPVTPKYSEPGYPTFTSKATVSERMPSLSAEYPTTKGEITADNSGIPAANTIDQNTNWDEKTVYLSTGNTWIKDAAKRMTIYFVDDIEFGTNTEGSVFVVAEGKTLTLTNVTTGVTIVLAKDAILDLTKLPTWSNGTITFNGGGIFMSEGSQIKATGIDVNFFNGCQVKNDNGSITAKKIAVDKKSVLWNDGPTFEVTTLDIANEETTVYNAKGRTMNVQDITTSNTDCLLYNEGIINATGSIHFYNKGAELVNAGSLEAAEFKMNASGVKFFNADGCTTTIHGITEINNSDAQWVNKGTYDTGDFTIYNAGQLFNDCKLTVHADAEGTTGTFTFSGTTSNKFVIMANSSVKTDNLVLSAEADMWLKENSMLWVVNKITSSLFNPDTGFQGPKSGYAVIKAGEIAYTSAFRWRMNYFGNLFVDTDTHFPQGYDTNNDPADQPHYYYDTTVKFKHHNDACPVSKIDAGDCHHGYTPPTTTIITSDADLRIMAEDLSAYDFTDFDFNDVVFDVYYGAANAAKIVVKAAGGTLPLRIKVGPGTSESDYVEVHGLWGEATNIMINTNASYANSKSGLGDKEVTLKYAVNDATDARDKIIIEVEKKNEQGTVQWIPMNAAVGKPAAKFACSPDLRWADERESLLNNSNFKDWVQDAIDTWKWNDDIK